MHFVQNLTALLQPCMREKRILSEQAKFTKPHVQVNHFEHMHMTFLYRTVSWWKLKAALAITARCVWRHRVRKSRTTDSRVHSA